MEPTAELPGLAGVEVAAELARRWEAMKDSRPGWSHCLLSSPVPQIGELCLAFQRGWGGSWCRGDPFFLFSFPFTILAQPPPSPTPTTHLQAVA